MRRAALFTAAAALASSVAAIRQPYEYLQALERFQKAFLDPQPVLQDGHYDLFIDDMVGRVDVTTTFEGAELNIEYLFGLFAGIRNVSSTSILGYPAAQTIQSLMVEPPQVYFSAVLELAYDTVGQRVPVQIDVMTAWNDDLKMISYDASFRRFPQAWEIVQESIAPVIAQELGETYDPATTNRSALMSRKAASQICPTAMQHCTGANQQYESYDECYEFLTEERRWGEIYEGGLDTTWCRYVHLNMVPFRPDVHCSHIGPSGGDMCVDRDYYETTRAFPFKQTFVAPNTTWNDRDMRGLSAHSISELAKAKLTLVFPTTVAFFSVPLFIFFIILYLSAKATESCFMRYSSEYRKLSPANQRNTVTYLLNTVFTTIALVLQLVASPVFVRSYSQLAFQAITLTAAIVSALYIFEMVYRESMRPSLLAHHFCTLLAIMSLFVTMEQTFHPAIVTVGAIWLFQATTEQSVFIGLLMYRLGCGARNTRRVLRFAAVQSFLFKFGAAIWLLVEHSLRLVQFHSDPRDVYFSVVVYVVGALLLATQVYGSWAVWAISLKLDKAAYCDVERPSHPAAGSGAPPGHSSATPRGRRARLASDGSSIGGVLPSPALSNAPTLVDLPVRFDGGGDSDGDAPSKHLKVPPSPV
ncbi:uncharacterized protein RHOBADRAFT_50669 [Rhodotorula graminis WP1]|uniref:Uncharacterized protein n=1 Tax=Rhodotorula graminis (strain WP1) TaxID=578459 RepID=A0A194SF35_RHOGW|nr:uncharacterized protein RHOBADRAFT_50669 [Rhodotorula graminis WP1]KPV78166.1 hypothetical protein RHOBADRAFT_50669 [Rhodotorula graminis WP1]